MVMQGAVDRSNGDPQSVSDIEKCDVALQKFNTPGNMKTTSQETGTL